MFGVGYPEYVHGTSEKSVGTTRSISAQYPQNDHPTTSWMSRKRNLDWTEFDDEKHYISRFSFFPPVNELSVWMLQATISTRISYPYSVHN
jgi:hypothetical protein